MMLLTQHKQDQRDRLGEKAFSRRCLYAFGVRLLWYVRAMSWLRDEILRVR